jgi:hypothetical protein
MSHSNAIAMICRLRKQIDRHHLRRQNTKNQMKSELDQQIDKMMSDWYAENPDDDRDWIEIVMSEEFGMWLSQAKR